MFKQQYVDRFEYHLKTTFSKEKMNTILEEMKNTLEPIMPEHIARWNYPENFGAWIYHINKIHTFFDKRPCYMLHHLITFFEIDDTSYGTGVCDSINDVQAIITNNSVSIWPNPSSDFINIDMYELNDYSLLYSIEITDLLGRKVLDVPILKKNYLESINVNIGNLNPGTYILVVRYQNKTLNKRFIKM